jgi:hypothetical protein
VWFLFSWSVFLAGELPVFSALAGFWKKKIRGRDEEKKSYGVVMLFVGVFVVFWSVSCLTACGAISRLMRLWPPTGPGVFSVTGLSGRVGYQERERTALEMNNLTLYCSGIALKPAMTQEKTASR